MINVTNENSNSATAIPENIKQNAINDLENSDLTKKIKKIKIDDESPLRPKRDRSTSFNIENKMENENENPSKSQKLKRNKTVVLDTKKKYRVKFKNDFVKIINVESYKKYNIDVSTNEENGETTKCRCLIF